MCLDEHLLKRVVSRLSLDNLSLAIRYSSAHRFTFVNPQNSRASFVPCGQNETLASSSCVVRLNRTNRGTRSCAPAVRFEEDSRRRDGGKNDRSARERKRDNKQTNVSRNKYNISKDERRDTRYLAEISEMTKKPLRIRVTLKVLMEDRRTRTKGEGAKSRDPR